MKETQVQRKIRNLKCYPSRKQETIFQELKSISQVGPTVRMVASLNCLCSPHLPRGEGGDGMENIPYLDDNGITMTAKAAGRRQGSQQARGEINPGNKMSINKNAKGAGLLSHPLITTTFQEETEYGMLASLMLGRSMKLEDGIFLSLKGLAEGRPYFRNVVQSQPVSLLYSVSIRFLTSRVGRAKLSWTYCAFELKR